MGEKRNSGRILAVDWGEKRIGIAISDETQTLARPLFVVKSSSRKENAERVAEIAQSNDPQEIIVGVTYDSDGNPTPTGRRAHRFAKVLATMVSCNVETVDEGRSTRIAKRNKILSGSTRKKRKGHLDAEAAAVILQQHLEERRFDG